VSVLETAHVTGKFDHGALHTKANPEERYFFFTDIADGFNFSFHPPFPESAGNQESIDTCHGRCSALCLNVLGGNFYDLGGIAMANCAVLNRFKDGFMRILKLGVFAHDTNTDRSFRLNYGIDHLAPGIHGCAGAGQAVVHHNLFVQSLLGQD